MPPTFIQLKVAASLATISPKPLDRLPYTPEFDQLYRLFIEQTGSPCTESECWNAFLGARKRGMIGPSRRRRRWGETDSNRQFEGRNTP